MATDWVITSQRQTDRLLSDGTFDPTMEINFETQPEGIKGQVVVSWRNYTPDNVRGMIDARVAAIKEVQNL